MGADIDNEEADQEIVIEESLMSKKVFSVCELTDATRTQYHGYQLPKLDFRTINQYSKNIYKNIP